MSTEPKPLADAPFKSRVWQEITLPVLNGYVTLIEPWGSDQAIIEAARVSTQKGFLGWGEGWKCSRALCDWADAKADLTRAGPCPACGSQEILRQTGDEKLLRYLWENKHDSPFEFAGLIIQVEAPIMVYREWHRHRTQGYSEASARYSPLPNNSYIPSLERLMMSASSTNKQAGAAAGAPVLTEMGARYVLAKEAQVLKIIEDFYQEKLALGVSKELARTHLNVSRMSRMRATSNLRNWLGFMTLRSSPNAQYEIRMYAEAIGKLLEYQFARTWELYQEGKRR